MFKEDFMRRFRSLKLLFCIGLMTITMVSMAGCGQTEETHVPGLDEMGTISAITREPDSGTRASFDDLIGIDSESNELTQVHATEDVLKAVEEDKASIGYLTLQGTAEDVKVLKVDGISADDRNYPLTRKLYLVYTGTPDDLEQEFIRFVTGKGQSIVSKEFEAVSAATTFLSVKPEGKLKIGGSSSLYPTMKKLADAYMQENPNADISVIETDSGTGINNTLEGKYDLGMSSRSPKDYEKSLLTFVPVAKDRIAVITAKDNPMESISTRQLKKIYTGKAREWKDLNSSD